MTALCENCGSISIERAKPGLPDKLVAVLTGRRLFSCRRCGWRGRRNWTDKDLHQLHAYGAGGAEPDPALAVLDGELRQRDQSDRRQSEPPAENFDLGTISFVADDQLAAVSSRGPAEQRARTGVSGKSRRRRARRRAGRRVITAALAAAAIIMFIVVFLSLTR